MTECCAVDASPEGISLGVQAPRGSAPGQRCAGHEVAGAGETENPVAKSQHQAVVVYFLGQGFGRELELVGKKREQVLGGRCCLAEQGGGFACLQPSAVRATY